MLRTVQSARGCFCPQLSREPRTSSESAARSPEATQVWCPNSKSLSRQGDEMAPPWREPPAMPGPFRHVVFPTPPPRSVSRLVGHVALEEGVILQTIHASGIHAWRLRPAHITGEQPTSGRCSKERPTFKRQETEETGEY